MSAPPPPPPPSLSRSPSTPTHVQSLYTWHPPGPSARFPQLSFYVPLAAFVTVDHQLMYWIRRSVRDLDLPVVWASFFDRDLGHRWNLHFDLRTSEIKSRCACGVASAIGVPGGLVEGGAWAGLSSGVISSILDTWGQFFDAHRGCEPGSGADSLLEPLFNPVADAGADLGPDLGGDQA